MWRFRNDSVKYPKITRYDDQKKKPKQKIPAYTIVFLLNRKTEVSSVAIVNNIADKSITKDWGTYECLLMNI